MNLVQWLIASYLGWKADRALAAHANGPRADGTAPTSVHFGWIARITTLVVCIPMTLLAALVIWAATRSNAEDGMWTAALVFGALALWLGYTGSDIFLRRIEWDETQIRFRKPMRTFSVPWEDITSLEEKSHPPHIRIGFRNGDGFAIFESMNDSRYFMRMIERRLGPDAPVTKRRKRRLSGKKA